MCLKPYKVSVLSIMANPESCEFKSLTCRLPDKDALIHELKDIVNKQEFIEVLCPPRETTEWDEEELDLFCLNSNSINRIYYFYSGLLYDMYGRMTYNQRYLYFHLNVILNNESWNRRTILGGKLYLTYDAEVFLKSVIDDDCGPVKIWRMMVEDGLQIEEPTIFDFNKKRLWSYYKVPTLKVGMPTLNFLCHLAVYKNQEILKPYVDLIPGVSRSINHFIKFREARDHHEKSMEYEEEEEEELQYVSSGDDLPE